MELIVWYTQHCQFLYKRLHESNLLAACGHWRKFHATSLKEIYTLEYLNQFESRHLLSQARE